MHTLELKRGFTIVELLMAVAIIGILATIVLTSMSSARAKARDSERLQDLREVRTALESYRNVRGAYPVSGTPGDEDWSGSCAGYDIIGDTSGADGWVPDLAPTYISVLPLDPKPGAAGSARCYAYLSNGRDYMLMAYRTVESFSPSSNPAPRPNYPTELDFAFYTPGAHDW